MKRWMICVMCILMLLSVMGTAAAEQMQEATELICSDVWDEEPVYVGGSSVDTRLMGFLQSADSRRDPAANSVYVAGKYLNAQERVLYEISKTMGTEVAWGRQATLQADVELEYPEQVEYTAAELGVAELVTDGKMNADAQQAMTDKVKGNIDMLKVYDAVRRDCPFEFYWEASYIPTLRIRMQTNGQTIWYTKTAYIQWYAAKEFAPAGTTAQYSMTVDTAKTSNVSSAVDNARSIVAKYAGLDDYDKLDAYQKEICHITSYYYGAIEPDYPYHYGNPWQILYALDGDPATEVVCEGYAKTFQFLCELSSFQEDVRVLSVSGLANGGRHMWNIVRTGDGRNHHVDVTWNDMPLESGGESSSYMFFAVPESGSVEEGYWFNNGIDHYVYDQRILNLYPAAMLDLLSDLGEPPEIITQPKDCITGEGRGAVFTIEAAGKGLSYQWECREDEDVEWWPVDWDDEGNSNELRFSSYTLMDGWQFRCVVKNQMGVKTYSDIAVLTVKKRPEITVDPVAQTACDGDKVTFRLKAEGYGLTYRWEIALPGGEGMEDGNVIVGSQGYDTDTFTFTARKEMDGAWVVCEVVDQFGANAYSTMVQLAVVPRTIITKQPADTAAAEGSMAAFAVEASGDGLTYQWQFRGPSSTGWSTCTSSVEGYHSNVLKPVALSTRNGYSYRCIITDASGKKVISDAAVLTVQAAFKITRQPANQTVQQDTAATFSVTAEGTGLTYQWQYRGPSSTGWSTCTSSVEGYRSNVLKPAAPLTRNGYSYRCVITDASGKKLISDAAVLTVQSALKITRQPANQTVMQDATASFTVTATGDGLTYQWQYRGPSSTGWSTCTSSVEGYHANVLKPVAPMNRNGYSYRCVITDAYGKKAISEAAVLTVQSALKIASQPADLTVQQNVTASFTVEAVGDGLTYQWQYRGPSSTGWTSCTSSVEGYRSDTLKTVATTARNGYSYRCVITDASGKKVISNAAVLTVQSALKITSQPTNQKALLGEAASFTVEATGEGLTYQWQYRGPNSTGWTTCTSSVEGYHSEELKPVAQLNRDGFSYRCVITDANGKKAISDAAVLTVLQPETESAEPVQAAPETEPVPEVLPEPAPEEVPAPEAVCPAPEEVPVNETVEPAPVEVPSPEAALPVPEEAPAPEAVCPAPEETPAPELMEEIPAPEEI